MIDLKAPEDLSHSEVRILQEVDEMVDLASFVSGLRQNLLLYMKPEMEKYTQRYLKQSQVNDVDWTPGMVKNKHAEVQPWKLRGKLESYCIFSRLEHLPQRIDASKKKSLCQSRSVTVFTNPHESAVLRMTWERLNPTGPNKKTRISQKENEDILNKLKVSSSLFLWFKNTIKVCYKGKTALLQDLEKKDSNPEKSDDETEKKADSDEEEAVEEEYNEEDIEEVRKNVLDVLNVTYKNNLTFSWQENDYIDSYFDNGEDFAAGSDDNMDGEATYWACGNY